MKAEHDPDLHLVGKEKGGDNIEINIIKDIIRKID